VAEHLTNRQNAYEVLTAADGLEAGRLVATFRPDLVLLDLRMPGLDGFQVCRTIKADPETSNTVVIALTGFYSPETETRILECGAIRCFEKPVEMSTLSSFIDSVFEQQRAGSKSRRSRRSRS
jgi:DNA-binding response OmpR family regulator